MEDKGSEDGYDWQILPTIKGYKGILKRAGWDIATVEAPTKDKVYDLISREIFKQADNQ